MEELLQYVWKHKIFPLRELMTVDGRTLEVFKPGLQNRDAGPDFIGAIVKIDGVKWVGDVELHIRTSDWFKHHHDIDRKYDNIILHVAIEVDTPLRYPNGEEIPQFQLPIPDYVMKNSETLLRSDYSPKCKLVVGELPKIIIHSWMSSLLVERLEMRMNQVMERLEALNKDWEATLFATIARNFGFGKNGAAFEQWASTIPMSAVGKHRDNLFQIEAIFFGQAGLLENDKRKKTEEHSDYYLRLQKEYNYLRQKFSLTPIDPKLWKFFRLRPQNFPYIRIAQLAMLYHKGNLNLSRLINAHSIEDIRDLLKTQVSDFWRVHYSFTNEESSENDKCLSESSMDLIIINSVVPVLFSYGRYKGDEALTSKAVDLWEGVKPENNRIIRDWADAGVVCENAADTQSLIHLTHNYCEKSDCFRCRLGSEYIKRTPNFLYEDESD